MTAHSCKILLGPSFVLKWNPIRFSTTIKLITTATAGFIDHAPHSSLVSRSSCYWKPRDKATQSNVTMSLCFLLFLLLLSSSSFVQARRCEVTIHYVGLQTSRHWHPRWRKLKGSKASKGGSKKSSKVQSRSANFDGPIEVWSYNERDGLCWSAFDRGTVALGSSRTFQCSRNSNHCQFNFDFPVSATTLQSGGFSCHGEQHMTSVKCRPPIRWPHWARGRCGRSYIVYFQQTDFGFRLSCFCRTTDGGRSCVGS